MKLFTIILLSLLVTKGCSEEQNQDLKAATLQYTAATRGFNQKIVIKDSQFTLNRTRLGKDTLIVKTISENDLKELIIAFQDVNLEELQNLQAPTNKRSFDAAAMANLKIIYKEKTYETAGFDHGFPPLEIEKLINKITSLEVQKQ